MRVLTICTNTPRKFTFFLLDHHLRNRLKDLASEPREQTFLKRAIQVLLVATRTMLWKACSLSLSLSLSSSSNGTVWHRKAVVADRGDEERAGAIDKQEGAQPDADGAGKVQFVAVVFLALVASIQVALHRWKDPHGGNDTCRSGMPTSAFGYRQIRGEGLLIPFFALLWGSTMPRESRTNWRGTKKIGRRN